MSLLYIRNKNGELEAVPSISSGGNVTEGYIRINADNIDSASIITVNEPIV